MASITAFARDGGGDGDNDGGGNGGNDSGDNGDNNRAYGLLS